MRFNLFALATVALAAGNVQAAAIPDGVSAAVIVSKLQAASAAGTKVAQTAGSSLVRTPSPLIRYLFSL
jgi:hypothetical protein